MIRNILKPGFKSGFTLLETMLALAIFAIVGMVCLEAYINSASHAFTIERKRTKALLASWKIEELRLENNFNMEGENGIFPMPYEGYEWEIGLSDIVISDTVYLVDFIPFKINITDGKRTYSMIAPFVKMEKRAE